MKKPITALLLLMAATASLTVTSTAGATADAATPISRYLTVANKPTPAQVDLLAQVIQVHFPPPVQTVGEAMHQLLRLSGYRLVPLERRSTALNTLLSKPLPAVDRNLGPLPLKDALTTLAGPAFYLVQDPVNRLVDLRLKPAFAPLYATGKTSKPVSSHPRG